MANAAPRHSSCLLVWSRLKERYFCPSHSPGPLLAPSPSQRLRDMLFERLPVDLIAEILGKLDLESLIQMSYVSKRFYLVASEPSLNPWRQPIMRNLRSHSYDPALKHLSVRLTVPRQNWIDILAAAMPSFILFDATLPNLRAAEWEECFKRRFLPSWEKWKKETSWKETYLKYVLVPFLPSCISRVSSRVLHRVWHRSVTSCTTDEAWTKLAFCF